MADSFLGSKIHLLSAQEVNLLNEVLLPGLQLFDSGIQLLVVFRNEKRILHIITAGNTVISVCGQLI